MNTGNNIFTQNNGNPKPPVNIFNQNAINPSSSRNLLNSNIEPAPNSQSRNP
jgi:hypothetical protein